MGVPRWFYGTLALCAVVTTAAVVYALVFRPVWVPIITHGVNGEYIDLINTHTRDVCAEWPISFKTKQVMYTCFSATRHP